MVAAELLSRVAELPMRERAELRAAIDETLAPRVIPEPEMAAFTTALKLSLADPSAGRPASDVIAEMRRRVRMWQR